ncbi:MAG: DHH family phosphoesterase [Desulfobacterales bacterium]|nr:DHH family phosphoesterase [Desulfobacterales bacterium]
MGTKNKERLAAFYSRFNWDDRVVILINADPDAIASAVAVKRLLWRRVSQVTLAAINTIKRPDNLALVRYMKVDIKSCSQSFLEEFNRFVLVDSQPHHSEFFEKLRFDAIIDHHPDGGRRDGYTDIRVEYGATASMMTEYLRAARIKPSSRLATGLLYAIKTDTNNFERKTEMEDVRAFQYLYRLCNVHMLQKMEQAELKASFLKYFQRALDRRKIKRGRIFAHVGNVSTPDVLVLIADFFMKVDQVSWSIVSGMFGKKLVVIFRNDGVKKNAGRLAQRSFGNFGSAGGHRDMARAEMGLSDSGIEAMSADDEKIQRWVIRQIEKRGE